MLPAGLSLTDNNRVEFFACDNQAMAFFRGEKMHFSQLPDHIIDVFRNEMKIMPTYCESIGIKPETEPMRAIEIYLMHEYGACDYVPDWDEKTTNKELFGEDARKEYGLSHREVEVLQLVGEGHHNKEIARKLFISEHTVETHSHNIKEKTGARNQVDMLRFSVHHHLVAI